VSAFVLRSNLVAKIGSFAQNTQASRPLFTNGDF
jgi:hypothetical protein